MQHLYIFQVTSEYVDNPLQIWKPFKHEEPEVEKEFDFCDISLTELVIPLPSRPVIVPDISFAEICQNTCSGDPNTCTPKSPFLTHETKDKTQFNSLRGLPVQTTNFVLITAAYCKCRPGDCQQEGTNCNLGPILAGPPSVRCFPGLRNYFIKSFRKSIFRQHMLIETLKCLQCKRQFIAGTIRFILTNCLCILYLFNRTPIIASNTTDRDRPVQMYAMLEW